ncbi:MAG: TIGR04222 domain-containing membrane protein [Waterburya sp.]
MTILPVKLSQKFSFLFLFLFSFAVTSCQANSGLPNPINFTGSKFLTFYILIEIIGIALASELRSYLRLASNAPDEWQFNYLSTCEVAFLKNRDRGIIDTAIISLVQQEHVEIMKEELTTLTTSRKLVLQETVDNINDPVEKLVAQKIVEVDGVIEEVYQILTGIGDKTKVRLQELKLVLSDDQSEKAQIYPSLIILFLLGIGVLEIVVKIFSGETKTVGFLIACIVGLLIFGGRFFAKPHRSRYGDLVLNKRRADSKHLKRANSSNLKLPLAFALFGITVLKSDSALADLDKLLTFGSTESHGSGGLGAGSGSYGGGGGGCGG